MRTKSMWPCMAVRASSGWLAARRIKGHATAKMISLSKESDLFRFTLKHSLLFAVIIGSISMLQAYVFTGMIPR
ncbi:hypothetical protein [Janthinobacterium sp. UMAB-56]|uniref:hypothetical protein n=1 Tax=Janthinobacterium sp. UMAB-56 TaxID=1365361 RepID=UPI001C58E322|nr:hypothetical protein [Janthinobacterium sp. UMAB-56]